ncbi:hypothetical protein COO20_07715 [Thalassospira marina]|uniref:Uncharacterized protein n=1 Tax=Thalassospira marina TaxID=2048283 RepID=A0A2N3KVL9_9PROT|nr:hypothetical protein COO20_07715 [Thalassospira marina]
MNKPAGRMAGQILNAAKLMAPPAKVQHFPRFLAGLITPTGPYACNDANMWPLPPSSLQLTPRKGLSKFEGLHKTVFDRVLNGTFGQHNAG